MTRFQQRLNLCSALSARLWRSSNSRPALLPSLPQFYRKYASTVETLPRVTQPSLWHSIVPKFLRTSQTSNKRVKAPGSKEWNPATFFIIIFMLIGSNAIQMIALRHDVTNFSRKADAKIELLKDVLGRLQRGEDVDIEGLLGTGDKEKEREWEDALHEIEEEDRLWQSKARNRTRQRDQARKDVRKAKETEAEAAQKDTADTPEIADTTPTTSAADIDSNGTGAVNGAARPGFY